MYTVGPSSSDDCQNTPAGTSAYTSDSPITMLPDGQVWTSVWHQDSNLVNVGSYDPASVNWVSDANPLGPEGLHDVARLLAISNTWGVATGYYSDTLMSVNFKTGAMTDIGSLPQSPADGLTWATNGDLLMAGNNDYIYRLPAAVLTSALGGTPVKSSDWLNLGDAVTHQSGTEHSHLLNLLRHCTPRLFFCGRQLGGAPASRSVSPATPPAGRARAY